jgi:Ser/Thr protein kinase RdoA (MazF antagonist)
MIQDLLTPQVPRHITLQSRRLRGGRVVAFGRAENQMHSLNITERSSCQQRNTVGHAATRRTAHDLPLEPCGNCSIHLENYSGTPEVVPCIQLFKEPEVRETTGTASLKFPATTSRAVREPSQAYGSCRWHIAHSTLSTAGIEELMLPNYNLTAPAECVLFARGMNDVYAISIPELRFALQLSHPNWRSRATVVAEVQALEHLGARGAEVAVRVRGADGGWITVIQAPEGPRRAVLFRWIGGRAPKYTDPKHAMYYGRHLANLHSASDDLPAALARPSLTLDYLLQEPLDLILGRVTHLPKLTAQLQALARRTAARFGLATQRLRDWGFCHGDVHVGNARIDDRQIASFDFDACATGWRIYDLASCRWDARRQGVEELAWRPFIEGYLQVRPEAADSLAFLRVFAILRHLWVAGRWIALSDVMGLSVLSEDFFEAPVPFCESIKTDDAKNII